MAVTRKTWMTDEMFAAWQEYYIAAGGTAVEGAEQIALNLFRDDPRYGTTWFPGIRDEDGVIRYQNNTPELTWWNNMQGYRGVVEGLRIDPDVFNEDYIDLISGDVTVQEFAQRVNSLNERVMLQGPAIRDFYTESLGIQMTQQAMLSALMSERVEQAIFERRLTVAEIGGEADTSGFDISAEFANLLAQEGMDRAEANRQFGNARSMVPLLAALARRQGDSSDFTIESFIEGAFMDDPAELDRMRMFQQSEAAQFTGGAQIDVMRQGLGLSGLDEL